MGNEINGEIEKRIGLWLGKEIRSWAPIVVLIVSLISFFVYQGVRVSVIEARAEELENQVDLLSTALVDLRFATARIDERTQLMQIDINFIKQRVK